MAKIYKKVADNLGVWKDGGRKGQEKTGNYRIWILSVGRKVITGIYRELVNKLLEIKK